VGSPKPDPYRVTRELIANAVQTARFLGENLRISNLVAGSVGRLMAELDDGDALLTHALACIAAEDAGYVPVLQARLQAMSASRS